MGKILGRKHDLDLSSHVASLCHSLSVKGEENLAGTLGAVMNNCTKGPTGRRLLVTARHSLPTRNMTTAPIHEPENMFLRKGAITSLFCYSANHFPHN